MAVDLSNLEECKVWSKLHSVDSDFRWALLRCEKNGNRNEVHVFAYGDAPLNTIKKYLFSDVLVFLLLRVDGVDTGAPKRIKTMVFSVVPSSLPFSARIAFGEVSKALVYVLFFHIYILLSQLFCHGNTDQTLQKKLENFFLVAFFFFIIFLSFFLK